MNNPNIYIIDAPCGAGKTSVIINHINSNKQNKYIYSTPYLSEVERIKQECKFVDPKNIIKGTKTKSFNSLIKKELNIVTTHSLAFRLNKDILNIPEKKYDLIIDEAPDFIKLVHMNLKNKVINTEKPDEILSAQEIQNIEDGIKADIECMKGGNRIEIVKDQIFWTDYNYKGFAMEQYKNLFQSGNIYYYKNNLIWCYNPDYLKRFNNIYILTHMFESQIIKSYFDMYKLEYQYLYVWELDGKYKLSNIRNNYNTNKYINLIYVYEGHLNNIGEDKYSLSKRWYEKNSTKYKNKMVIIKNNMTNYTKNIIRAKSTDIIWTCFKDNKDDLKNKGYTKGYLACNARATNEFSDRHIIMYPINRFPNPIIENFLKSKGVPINRDKWSQSELIQFIFRSAIRNEEEIEIYIPSFRMRSLLYEYLNSLS